MSSNNLGSGPATMGGQAARIPAQRQVTPEEGAALLQSQGGSLTAQVTVTRKETGAVEHHALVFSPAGQQEA